MALLDPPQPSAEPLEGRLEFETLIADLSSRFINLPPARVDPEIDDALRRVCERLDLDLAVLWQWGGKNRHVLAPTHMHPQRADGPGSVAVQDEYPWTVAQMLAGRPIVCAALDQLPAEAVVDREAASRAGIKSNLTLPLAVGGEPPVGALAFSTTGAERAWPPLLVQRLGLVAQVFTNALARRHADEALREAEERVSLAADSAEAGLWTLDSDTGVFWVTNRTRAIFGFGPDESIDMARFQVAVYPEDWEGSATASSRLSGARPRLRWSTGSPGPRRADALDCRAGASAVPRHRFDAAPHGLLHRRHGTQARRATRARERGPSGRRR